MARIAEALDDLRELDVPLPERILLFEDDPSLASQLESDLTALGAIVLPVQTCKQALDALANEEIDLAILDFEVGDEDCTVVAEACIKRRIPYFITSGLTAEQKLPGSAPRLIRQLQSAREEP